MVVVLRNSDRAGIVARPEKGFRLAIRLLHLRGGLERVVDIIFFVHARPPVICIAEIFSLIDHPDRLGGDVVVDHRWRQVSVAGHLEIMKQDANRKSCEHKADKEPYDKVHHERTPPESDLACVPMACLLLLLFYCAFIAASALLS